MPKTTISAEEARRVFAQAVQNTDLPQTGVLPPAEEEVDSSKTDEAVDPPAGTEDKEPTSESTTETGVGEPAKTRIFGKYETLDEASDAHWNLHEHAAQVKAENAALRAQLAAKQADANGNGETGSAIEDAVKGLEAYGVDSEVARKAIAAVAAETFQKMLTPVVESGEAQAYMRKNYRGYADLEGKMLEFVSKDADTKRAVDGLLKMGDPKTAHIVAWTRFKEAHAGEVEAATKARATSDKANIRDQKNDAQLTASHKSTPVRRPDAGEGPTPEQMAELLARARGGDPVARARLIAIGQRLKLS